MSGIDKFFSIFRIEELRKKIVFTLSLLVVYRIGTHLPTPGIDASILAQAFNATGVLGLFDLFAGGAFSKASIFALGIMPYISASIMFQLLGAVLPSIKKLQEEGEEGRKKIGQYTRYLTVLIASLQAYGTATFLTSLSANGQNVVTGLSTTAFVPLTIITFTAGTIFVMWLGEQITARGIGNGISLIIFIGIIAQFPEGVYEVIEKAYYGTGGMSFLTAAIMGAAMAAVTASVILVTRAQRRIPVQYPRKVIGRKVYSGQTTHLPLSVNSAGVIPIIFAQSIMMLPLTAQQIFPDQLWLSDFVSGTLAPGGILYSLVYGLIIVFFGFFYTAIVFNPQDVAENIRKNGGFIPGIRPGRRTAEYIERVLTRITLPGAIFFALIAILPWVLINKLGVQIFFGGTGLLIVVGVALDTLQQIESHLVMRHYEGFMKKGRIRGRSY
ncbi:MAG: preprotein translocase subunit SecY [Candidatus Zixiibacteriota bacterium]